LKGSWLYTSGWRFVGVIAKRRSRYLYMVRAREEGGEGGLALTLVDTKDVVKEVDVEAQ